MQFKKLGKIVAAGAMASVMMGATIGFAATLDQYPAPFVSSAGVNSLIVVGSQGTDPAGLASDVVGAVNVAARLGSAWTSQVSVSGATSSGSVSGEGKIVETATTKVFLNDTLGKTGLRTTMTKDDLPTILASGSFDDADGTHKYTQYIDLTPPSVAPTPSEYALNFDRPGSSSSSDPTYNFGRFPPSPSDTDFMYKTRVAFDVPVNGTAAIGKVLNLFGGKYTVDSTTSSDMGLASSKLVLLGSADTKTLNGGQTVTVTVGSTSYDIKLIGVTSAPAAAIQVGDQTETVNKGSTSTKFGDLKVYVDDAAQLSTTDQTQNYATLLIGANRITLQNASKVKVGTSDDPKDGTYVGLTASSGKLSQITVYQGASSSTKDYIAVGDTTYLSPVWKAFGLNFGTMTPAVGGASDDSIAMRNSGDNNLQLTFVDSNGNSGTINWAYKGTSAGTTFTVADSSGNVVHTAENEPVARDEYIVLDAGGFPHMFKVSGVSLDSSTSASIELQDVMSSTTTKITTGSDNQEAFVIDGQTYNFARAQDASHFRVTWGTGSATNLSGTYQTVYPALKTQNGASLAFANVTDVANGTTVQLPTGAVTISSTNPWTLTAVAKDDGTASVVTNTTTKTGENNVTFSLGRTATGALLYNAARDGTNIQLSVVGSSGAAPITVPSIILVEEKDDNGNQAAVVFKALGTTSSGNTYAGVDAPLYTSSVTSGAQSWGSNSNKNSYNDYWGTLSVRDSSSANQPSATVSYPDIQRFANVFVLGKDASISAGGTSGGSSVTVSNPVKTAIAKLDSEVSDADKQNSNLILVGGPAVNSLVKTLADGGKTWTRTQFVSAGPGSAIVQEVNDAFTSGKAALVVAGYAAADTRFVTGVLQNYDSHASELASKTLVYWKNGAVTTAPVA